jgi:SAM-dependent methyltransferase
MTEASQLWNQRAEAYRTSKTHAEGQDLDLVVEWCAPGPGRKVLDIATGGGHVARRLREHGCQVVTTDSSPAMKPDVVSRAEDLPFADGSFDCVVSRIAPHHFGDVGKAVEEMARVSNDVVVIEDTLFSSDRHEQAEQLRDPTHVRNYTENEWVGLLTYAGLEVEQRHLFEKVHPLEPWLARTGCEGDQAERVRELLADRMTEDGAAWTDVKIVLKARKSQG